jgi:transcription antitermination protein NusB
LHCCDIALTDTPLFNRRFIRLQAVQRLYAFYICKRANYDWALDQIRDDFIPDVFAILSVDKAQLAQETQQAMALFSSSLMSSSASSAATGPPSSRVSTVVDRALASYKDELAKDVRSLEGGLTKSAVAINQACVRIWQLLVEWAHIATKQAERLKLSQQDGMISSGVCLSHSPMLQRLQDDDVLAKRVQQEGAGWGDYMPQVESWYNQLVKKDPAVQRYLTCPVSPVQDQQLLEFLIDNIIFKEGVVLSFFYDLDLRWATHKHVVRRLVHQGLSHFVKNPEKGLSIAALSLASHRESEWCFYTDLVHRTLQKDEELEALIAQKARNWAIDRIMLLDKTIIKLALCEMLYFVTIPIKVSINEYIDLSKAYSMPKSSQFVNGLLDAVADTLRLGGGNTA